MSGEEASSGAGAELKVLAVVTISAVVTFLTLGSGIFEPSYNDVKDQVAAQLKDHAIAQFRDIYGSGNTHCGEVNARNSFDAYTGFKPFVVQGGTVMLEPVMPPGANVTEQADYYEEQTRFMRLQRACRD